MTKLSWKVCGMREKANIQEVLELKPDFMGFIFFDKSPRDVSAVLSESLLRSFPTSTKKIGVFVNAAEGKILEMITKFQLDGVQLHGAERPYMCDLLKNKGLLVIKAFSVDLDFDFAELEPYQAVVDIFLFDTKIKGAYGGHGVTFDWEILKSYPYQKPYLIAGGVSLENIDELKVLKDTPLLGVDVNSKFEMKPAVKDLKKLRDLVQILN